MPLSFRSENHGNIAFGFFNIESDMLLLGNYFFFADIFCQWVIKMASGKETELKKINSRIYFIADTNDIGDLMGAIHGVNFTGFIGKLYVLFPFPVDLKAFKQNPKGFNTRKIVKSQIEPFAIIKDMSIELHGDGTVHIGHFLFNKNVFHELIQYVWQGGYPRWKDEIRPQYVVKMKEGIQKSCNPFFKGVFLS